MAKIGLISLPIICLVLVSGCLLNHSHETIIRQGEPLYPVTFETEEAHASFEAYVDEAEDNDDNFANSSFGIPLLIGLSRSKKTSVNAIRNDATIEFDINGDGMISDYEASHFFED